VAVFHVIEGREVLRYQFGLRKTHRESLSGQTVEVHQGVAEQDNPSGNRTPGSDGKRAKAAQGTPCRRVLYPRC
jgi:hypothetical protein